MENKSIYKKLLKAKKEMEAITKDSKNPFFKSNYFDINKILSEVEPILQEHGLLLLQPIKNGLVLSEIIDVDTDEIVSSEIQLPMLNDPQKLGSAITYYRRYTLQSLLGLQAEDDDANAASKKEVKRNPTITDDELTKLKLPANKTVKNIDWLLTNRRMAPEVRKGLELLKKEIL